MIFSLCDFNFFQQEGDCNSDHLDEMMVQLWSIVNEKNDILRRQTELDYLRRGHRLEVIFYAFLTSR